MRSSLRFLPFVVAPLIACTVYQVPPGGDTDGAEESGGGTEGTSTGTGTGAPDPTTSTGSTTGTTVPDPSAGPSSEPGTSNDPTADPTANPPAACDFPTSIQSIFSARCGCHASAMPPLGLSLAEDQAYGNLVGVDSVQQAGTPRVAPGDPAGSWLVTKIKPAPPVGMQMPEGGMLDAEQVALIEAWIEAGAPAVDPFPCDGGDSGGDAGSVKIDEQGPINLEITETFDLDATVFDAQGEPVLGATVTWTSSDESVLYVDRKGTLLGIKPGVSNVTAEVDGVASAPVTVTVLNNQAIAAVPFVDVAHTLTTSCGCHKGAMPPAGLGFDLPAADLYAALLAPATQDPGLKRIQPDLPGQSYLFNKLTRTTQATGEQMPKGNAPLDAEKVQVLIRWIFSPTQP